MMDGDEALEQRRRGGQWEEGACDDNWMSFFLWNRTMIGISL